MIQPIQVVTKYNVFCVKFDNKVIDGKIDASIPGHSFTIHGPVNPYATSGEAPEPKENGRLVKFKGDDLLEENVRNATIMLRNAGLNLAMRKALFAYPFNFVEHEYSSPVLYRDGSIGEYSPGKKYSCLFTAITWSTDTADAGQTIGLYKTREKAIDGIVSHITNIDTQGGLDEPTLPPYFYDRISEDLRVAYKEDTYVCMGGADFYRIQRVTQQN